MPGRGTEDGLKMPDQFAGSILQKVRAKMPDHFQQAAILDQVSVSGTDIIFFVA